MAILAGVRSRIPRRFVVNLPGSPRLWVMLGVACLTGYAFLEVADFVFDDVDEGGRSHAFDEAVAKYLQDFRSPRLTQVAIDFTSLGSSSLLAFFALVAYAAVFSVRDRRGLMHLTIAMFGAMLWPELLKGLFERERPPGVLHLVPAAAFSFPSGHSFGAAACYATFAFFFARYVPRVRSEVICYTLAAVIVLIVGTTRVYLGVHYATDVLAGLSAGAAWAFLVAAAFSLWYQKPERKPASGKTP